MGKKAKEHRKKVEKRNRKLNELQKKNQKIGMEFLMKLIEMEKKKGLFNGEVQPLPNSNSENETENSVITESQEIHNQNIIEPTDVTGPQI